MKTKILLLLIVFSLTGCASVVRSIGRSVLNDAVGAVVHSGSGSSKADEWYSGKYMLKSPEEMMVYLPEPSWKRVENSSTSNSQKVKFERNAGNERILIETFGKSALIGDFKQMLEYAKTDSAKIQMMLKWKMGQNRVTNSEDAVRTEGQDLDKRRAWTCIAADGKKVCDFAVYTENENWVFVNVSAPLSGDSRELGVALLDQSDEQKVADADTDTSDKKEKSHDSRTWRTLGGGMAIWYNWEDEDLNPDRDFSKAVILREGKIFDTGDRFAFTSLNIYGWNPGDAWHNWGWRAMYMIGFRVNFFNFAVTPFVGAQFGLGMQYDDHYSKFRDKFAINIAGDVNAGMVFCRYCKYQFEVGAVYDAVEDGFFNDQVFGAFNFYTAVNY